MTKVFVSGCYDIMHGGHVEFFRQARAQGDYLIVCLPSDEVLFDHKKRRPFISLEHKVELVRAIRYVDEVVIGADRGMGLNFKTEFLRIRPQVLAVTDDDRFETIKTELCREVGARYVRLPKELGFEKTSTTDIYHRLRAPAEAPLRIDFAGGWLDVPRFSRPDGYIVNCAISPMVSLHQWAYEKCSGMGGSGAYALLCGKDGVESELSNNVGWQDPVIITETGLCVWISGPRPVLEAKLNPTFLAGHMAIHWTGLPHCTADLSHAERDYVKLAHAGRVAREGALNRDFARLCEGVSLNYQVQLAEGMAPLPSFGERAVKYCGSGHGGYAVYLFDRRPESPALTPIEPYMKAFMA
jgi:cytidyltransferase-like protein